MNGVGLDTQRTVTQMILREGAGRAARLRSVGDGVRDLIAHLVAENAFGARAADAACAQTRLAPDPTPLGPWVDPPGAALFWKAMKQRLTAYLGRVEPTQRNAFAVCAAVQARDVDAARKAFTGVMEAAGWEDVAIVSAPQALAAAARGGEPRRRTAVLAVGENLTSLALFDVIEEEGGEIGLREIERAVHLDIGFASWEAELRDEVRRRASGELRSPAADIAFRAAAMEFGAALGRDQGGRPVVWTGPQADRHFTELALSRDDCAAWPSVQRLTRFISEKLADAAKLDRIVVGGIGAAWPYAASACARFGPVWRSGAPWEDVARGAAYLAGSAAMRRAPRPAAIAPPHEGLRAQAKPAADENEIPPWLRRG